MNFCIKQTRINNLSKLQQFDFNQIQLGVPVKSIEAEIVGLKNVGDTVLPDAVFGCCSRKNAYGDKYPDKSAQKESRIVSTIWMYPYGNKDALQKPVDISKMCYPVVEVPPYAIELLLYESESGNRFVVVDMTDRIRKYFLKEAVNLLLEIYGYCYVFDGEIQISDNLVRRRCNWEILPPGEMPSRHVERNLAESGVGRDTFEVYRLEQIEKYHAIEVVEGINGFRGYYAYVFEKHCVLESAMYGNATYIIPSDGWEVMSQRTKQELFNVNVVERKIIHRENWIYEIKRAFRELEIDS